jgi:DNA transposition AAA+ family ATPase
MARHFLELEDAATLETEHYLLARRAVTDALERCAMAVIHGSAGLGKTYAVDELVEELDIEVIWTSFPSRPTPRLVAATLYEQLCGRRTRLDRFSIISRIVERLANGPRLVVVDESQLLTGDCIELLRYLHDHRQMECPRGRGHLIAWVCPTRREGCGVHAKDASAVPRGVSS